MGLHFVYFWFFVYSLYLTAFLAFTLVLLGAIFKQLLQNTSKFPEALCVRKWIYFPFYIYLRIYQGVVFQDQNIFLQCFENLAQLSSSFYYFKWEMWWQQLSCSFIGSFFSLSLFFSDIRFLCCFCSEIYMFKRGSSVNICEIPLNFKHKFFISSSQNFFFNNSCPFVFSVLFKIPVGKLFDFLDWVSQCVF